MEIYHGVHFEQLALLNRAVKNGIITVEGYFYLLGIL